MEPGGIKGRCPSVAVFSPKYQHSQNRSNGVTFKMVDKRTSSAVNSSRNSPTPQRVKTSSPKAEDDTPASPEQNAAVATELLPEDGELEAVCYLMMQSPLNSNSCCRTWTMPPTRVSELTNRMFTLSHHLKEMVAANTWKGIQLQLHLLSMLAM